MHQRPEVEERAAVQVHVVGGRARVVPVHQALADAGRVAEHRAVGPALERRGVDDEERRRGVDGPVRVVGRLAGEPGLVAVRSPSCRTQRAVRPATRTGGADGVADLLLLPDHDARVEVVDDERQLLGPLAPVGRAEQRPELGRGQEALEQPERVLAEPQHAVAVP